MARSAITKSQLGKISMEIGIEGMAEIDKNIAARLNRMMGNQAKKVWIRAGLVIAREIRDNIHSFTGKLSAGVFVAPGKATKPNVLVGVSIGARGKAPHGWLVEFGHVIWRGGQRKKGKGHQLGEAPAHPYFKPGVTAARPLAAAIVAEGMRDLATKP